MNFVKISYKRYSGIVILHYPFYFPVSNVHEVQNMLQGIIVQCQFGEGWGIPGRVSELSTKWYKQCQYATFGCIANHVISKGIEKRTKELFPNMNLLFLDFDSGMSEANIYNRLHFMIKNAQVEVSSDAKQELVDAM